MASGNVTADARAHIYVRLYASQVSAARRGNSITDRM